MSLVGDTRSLLEVHIMARTPKSPAVRKPRTRKSPSPLQVTTPPPSDAAESSGASGRNANGTFAKGNAFGPGNPHARACARMLAIFRNAISDEEMHRLFRTLFEKAADGDISAAKLILSYKIGKPLAAPNPDSIDRDEWEHYQQDVVDSEAMKHVLGSLPSRVGNDIARIGLPVMTDARMLALSAKLHKGCPVPEAQPAKGIPEQADQANPNSLECALPIPNGESVSRPASPDKVAPPNEALRLHNNTAASSSTVDDDSSAQRRAEADHTQSQARAKNGQPVPASDKNGVNVRSNRSQRKMKCSRTKPIANGKNRKQPKKCAKRKSAKALWLQPVSRRLRDGADVGSSQAAKK